MFNYTHTVSLRVLWPPVLAVLLLLPAGAPAVPATQPPEPATAAPPTPDTSLHFSLDAGTLATGSNTETVPAVAPGGEALDWEGPAGAHPCDLPGVSHRGPLDEAADLHLPGQGSGRGEPGSGQTAATLQTLISSPQEIPDMPFLPQMNMVQMMHANIQYLDFKTG